MNKNQNIKKSTSKDNLQNKNNVKPLILTFLGTFVVFFFVFTVLLPIFTPQVDIPVLTDEHSMDSVTSNDFKGRIDPRLSSIEQEENTIPPKLKMENPTKMQQSLNEQNSIDNQNSDIYPPSGDNREPQDITIDEASDIAYNNDINSTKTAAFSTKKSLSKTVKSSNTANIPPRPQPYSQPQLETAKPITMSKVILGSYATPMQARLISDTLIEMDLNVAPFIKEKNGRYMLQVGSFSDPAKAENLVQELKNKGFDAKTVNE